MKRFEILTLFPEIFPGSLGVSIFKRSMGDKWDLKTHDLRKYGVGKNRQVDDEVFSNLPGMLIRPDVIDNAMADLKFSGRRIFMSPRGKVLTQSKVEELAACSEDILVLCGRYEGVDQRAINYFNFEEISIGNYILSGGEVAALAMLEAIVRKIPGVIGNCESFSAESFCDVDNLEISEDRYTRPAVWETLDGDVLPVEEILLSGDHKKIELFQKSRRKCINNM